MAGRNDDVIVAALEVVAQAVGQQPTVGAGNDGVRMLETFSEEPSTNIQRKV